MKKLKDISGGKFGKITAVWPSGYRRHCIVWFCVCDCGKHLRASEYELRRNQGNITVCKHRQIWGDLRYKNGKISPEYRAYSAAKERCNNPNRAHYKDYGGRGIEFRFKDFGEFFEEIGVRPSPKYSLDRINVNGHYEIGNIRWATYSNQVKNRRQIFAIENFPIEVLLAELKRRKSI